MSRPIVAIVGRPNVGKSTLFNRMIKQRKAIVNDRPGITRDRIYGDCFWNRREFILIDTGGFVPRSTELITSMVTQQVKLAIDQSDLVLFLLDNKVGVQTVDEEIAGLLKKSHKSVVVAANKADSEELIADTTEFYKLGLGEVYPVSAISGRQTGDLLDAVVDKLPPLEDEQESGDLVKVAIVGCPNVGKSSLFNAIVGEERQIVSETPGTTRDSVDTLVEIQGKQYKFIDTAGLRHKRRYPDIIEYFSSIRSIRAIERADIVLVVLDTDKGIVSGDIRVAGEAERMGRGLVFIANKWDLVKGVEQFTLGQQVYEKAPMMKYVKIVFTCAIRGHGIDKVIDGLFEVESEMNKRITTSELNTFIEAAVKERHPPARAGKFIKFYYVTQADSQPPTFVFFCNFPKLIDDHYKRYLENKLRNSYGFTGAPLKLFFRSRSK